MVVVVGADVGAEGEAGRDGQADVGHLGEVGPLAAEEVLHVGVAVGLAVAEEVDVLGHGRLFLCKDASVPREKPRRRRPRPARMPVALVEMYESGAAATTEAWFRRAAGGRLPIAAFLRMRLRDAWATGRKQVPHGAGFSLRRRMQRGGGPGEPPSFPLFLPVVY